MKKIIVIFIICFMATTVYAEKSIVGEWKHKDGATSTYEFKENQDFIMEYNTNCFKKNNSGKYIYKKRKTLGVWSYDNLVVTYKGKPTEKKINLVIYLGECEYCFYFKFVGDNLIMTKREIGYTPMLNNMVLVRVDPFTK